MSASKILVHLVWSTKNRLPFINNNIKQILFTHIRQNAIVKGIEIIEINGYVDHVHCLINLQYNQKIEDVVKLIKGESSHWINKNNLLRDEFFQWQAKYFAESISIRDIDKLRGYIKNQELHHQLNSINIMRELHL
jgi:putative transposase